LALTGKKQEAYVQYKSAAAKIEAQTELLKELADYADKDAAEMNKEADAAFNKAVWIIIAVSALAVLLSGKYGAGYHRSVGTSQVRPSVVENAGGKYDQGY
jgi:hypothetical protein